MLDFLILGKIPGTSVTLTITWVLIFGLIFSLTILSYIEYKKYKASRSIKTENRKLVEL